MKNLFCPWRSGYSLTTNKKPNPSPDVCIFCTQPQENKDYEHFIVHRSEHAYVMLNLYPYNAGHLLIIPYDHKAFLDTLTLEAQHDLIQLCSKSCAILTQQLKAEGINMGFNIGRAAGAGIPSHLHMHVVPRWIGDTNFMPVLAETKQISFDLREIYDQIKVCF